MIGVDDLQLADVNAAALRLYPGLLYHWLPGGTLHGDEYTVLNPSRNDASKGSFKINIVDGRWADFATPQRGTNPVGLYAEFFCDGNFRAALLEVARQIGMLTDRPAEPAIARIMDYALKNPKPEIDQATGAGWTLIPAPAEVIPDGLRIIPAGFPTWTYFTPEGEVLGYITRLPDHRSKDGKKYFPTTYWQNQAGVKTWRHNQFVGVRPIYNVLDLAEHPTWPVVIVEGEKAAEAGIAWLVETVVLSWPGGSNTADKVDWRALQGRIVCLLPDHDEAGRKAMRAIADKLKGVAAGVWLLEVEPHRPVGWDIADGVAAKEWATPELATEWLDTLPRTEVTGVKAAVDAAPKTPKQERIEQALARGNGTETQYEVVPEKAVFEPFPVPALQGMADWIDSQVGISHPLVTQSITLALASLAVGRRYRSPHGGQGGLSFGLVADSVGELHDYLDVTYRILDAAGLRRLVRMTRFASDSQLYQSLEKAPAQMYLSADYGTAVALTKKQTSGAMESLLSALTAVSRGKNVQLDRSQVADPKMVMDDNPVLYEPALTVVALLAFDSLTALWRSGEYGRGAVESFSYAFAYAEDQVVRGVPPEDEVPDWLLQNLQMMRGVTPGPAGVAHPLSSIFSNNGLFAFDPILIASAVSTADYALLMKPLDDLLKTNIDVRPVILAGRRRVGFIATLLAVFGGTAVTADLVAYAVRFELARFEGFKRQKHQAKQDKEQGVYEQVLAVIAKHRHQGILRSYLPAESWAYRRLDDEERVKLILKMKNDGVIMQIDPAPTGKAGRQPAPFLVAKAYVRKVKVEVQA